MVFTFHPSAPVKDSGVDRQLVLTLIQNLKYLHRITKTLALPIHDIEIVLAQIENQTLSVVVVGEFNRGKSTFINALLGQEILPSDILPTTATINRIVFGSTPSATIHFKDGREQSIAIGQLANHVTKLTSDTETISSRVQEALIHYPSHYCQNGVEIIDTPGLSDDDIMTEVTLSVLRRTEIVIMVISAISPFAESEGVFLTEKLLEQGIDHILFVVNGIDHFTRSEDIDRVLQNITHRIEKHIHDWADRQFGGGSPEYNAYMKRMGNPRLYGLSSQQALQAKRTGDTFLLERSRFQEFETSLNFLLTQERQWLSLQMSARGAIAAATEILQTIKTQQDALQVQQQSTTKKILSIIENLSMLRMQSREELDHLDRGFIDIESKVTTIINTFGYQLEQVAEQTIEHTSVDMSSHLNGITSHFADQVVSALRKVISSIESDITGIASRETQKQSLRLKIIAKTIDRQIYQIQDRCSQMGTDLTLKDSVSQHCNADNQISSPRLSNLFSVDSSLFFIQGQAKGGYTLTGAAIGSLFGGVGAPIGAAIGANFGDRRRKQTFKEFYKPEVLSVIKTKFNSQDVNRMVNQYVAILTGSLKTSVYETKQQIEVIVDSIETDLYAFQGQREAEFLAEQNRLEQLSSEIQKILDDTLELLSHLN